MSAGVDWSLTLMVAVDESMPEIVLSSWNVAASEKEDLGIQYLIARLVNAWDMEREYMVGAWNFHPLREVLVLPDKLCLRRVKDDFTGKNSSDSLFCI